MRHPLGSLAAFLVLVACAPGTNSFFLSPLAPAQRPQLAITVKPVDASLPYDRDDWSHWSPVPGTCYNIRAAVLITESLRPTSFRQSSSSCFVDSGMWVSPYSGDTVLSARELQIDHMVPLHEAHLSGGAVWDTARKREFANDTTYPHHLLAVEGALNGKKSDSDPTEWLPATPFRCTYFAAWATIKSTWNLSMDSAEYRLTREGLDSCAAAGVEGMPGI